MKKIKQSNDLKESYKYYSDEELRELHLDANPSEKRRITLELNRRHPYNPI